MNYDLFNFYLFHFSNFLLLLFHVTLKISNFHMNFLTNDMFNDIYKVVD
jgi:hypothetical protein